MNFFVSITHLSFALFLPLVRAARLKWRNDQKNCVKSDKRHSDVFNKLQIWVFDTLNFLNLAMDRCAVLFEF